MQPIFGLAVAISGAEKGFSAVVSGMGSPMARLGGAMIPGVLFTASGEIEINAGRPTVTLTVANTGDRLRPGRHRSCDRDRERPYDLRRGGQVRRRQGHPRRDGAERGDRAKGAVETVMR